MYMSNGKIQNSVTHNNLIFNVSVLVLNAIRFGTIWFLGEQMKMENLNVGIEVTACGQVQNKEVVLEKRTTSIRKILNGTNLVLYAF